MLIPSFLIAVDLEAQLGKYGDVFSSSSALIRIGGKATFHWNKSARITPKPGKTPSPLKA
jgi:hypothetical protein